MKATKKLLSLTTAAVLAGVLITGCGGQSGKNDTQAADSKKEAAVTEASKDSAAEVKKVKIGTGASAKPYIYTDDNNNIIGYEAEVIQAIDDYLPDYEFEFEITDFPSIFLGIDSGIYQMGANNITKKPEREEKYLFANEYDMYNYTVAIVRKGEDGIKTLEDLGGRKTYVGSSGGFAQFFIESYNAEHAANPILTEYTEADQIKSYQDLANGVIDFTLTEIVMFDSYLEEYPDLKEQLEYVQFSDEETAEIQDPYGWFIYPKTDEGEEIRDAVDKALSALKEDGTITKISDKYLGYDVAATK